MFDLQQSTIDQMRQIDELKPLSVSVAKQFIENIEKQDRESAIRLVDALDLLSRFNPELNVETIKLIVSGAAPKATEIFLENSPTIGDLICG